MALAEDEHLQLAFRYDSKDLRPGLVLSPPASRLPVLLASEHAFLGPWGAVKSQLLVGDADARFIGTVAGCTVRVVLLCFPDDRPGQVRGKADGRREECRTG